MSEIVSMPHGEHLLLIGGVYVAYRLFIKSILSPIVAKVGLKMA